MTRQPLVMPKATLMTWNGNKISDHNRGDLQVSVERIEESSRMANGTLRKFIVADKRKFSTEWSDLPQNAMYTVDGFWGKNEIENWYNTVSGSFTLEVTFGDGTKKQYTVMMSNFNASLSKRGAYDFWSVQVEMEEV